MQKHHLLAVLALLSLPSVSLAQRIPADIEALPRAPLDLFDIRHDMPLDVHTTPVLSEAGVAVSRISYTSPAGGRVTGHLYVPEGPGPFAGIVYAHGTGSGSRTQGPRAVYLARHGAVVLTVDAPYIRDEADPLTFTSADSARQVQHIQDLRRAIDVLAARSDVDAGRLAFIGRSHGGAMGVMVAALEPRLATAILIVADGGLVAHLTTPFGYTPLPEQPEEVQTAWIRALWPLEPVRYVEKIQVPILFQNSMEDEAVPFQEARALHAAMVSKNEVRWYPGGHRLDVQSFVDQLDWLHEYAGMRAPDDTDSSGPDFGSSVRDLGPEVDAGS